MIITWVHQYAMSICLMRCPFALCDAHLPNAMHAPDSQDGFSHGQRSLHSLLDAMATAVAMA